MLTGESLNILLSPSIVGKKASDMCDTLSTPSSKETTFLMWDIVELNPKSVI